MNITESLSFPTFAFPISNTELQILDLISRGYSNEQVASKIFRSVHTVNQHRKNILKKMEVHNTALLMRRAFESGLLQ